MPAPAFHREGGGGARAGSLTNGKSRQAALDIGRRHENNVIREMKRLLGDWLVITHFRSFGGWLGVETA